MVSCGPEDSDEACKEESSKKQKPVNLVESMVHIGLWTLDRVYGWSLNGFLWLRSVEQVK